MNAKTLFVYNYIHRAHKDFAESVNADLRYQYDRLNFERIPEPLKGIINAIALPKYSVYLGEDISPFRPDTLRSAFTDSINIKVIANSPFLLLKKENFKRKVNYKIKKNLAKYIDGAIAVSQLVKEEAEKIMDAPIKVAHPPIKDENFTRLAEINSDLSGFNIISIGGATWRKGMDILVKGFKKIREKIPKSRLYLLGEGHPRKWNKIKGVNVPGWVDDLTPYLEKADLYVHAARADPFPVSTLEALRAGLPIMVSERTGTKEVAEKLDDMFVRRVDSNDIADGISNYFSLEENEKRKLSSRARELSQNFSEKKCKEVFKRQFNSLLQEIKK